MKLNLQRPMIFFDLETTGTDVMHDRIVEISIIKVFPDGTEAQRTLRINPGCHIPEGATAVHHITDEDVADKPAFRDIASKLAESFAGCDLAGFNSNRFDIPLLAEEFARAGVDFDFSACRFVDVQTIFHKKEQRTLTAAYRFYCDRDLEAAHSANADTRATYEVLMAQLDRYDDLPNDVDKLAEYSSQTKNVDLMGRLIYDDQHREVINFGKYKGQLAADVLRRDPGYYNWIQQGDFPSNTKRAFTAIKLRAQQR
ncbi:MAG: exonuclease domain-containing protein [Muribaculaceae bacterium]|nr:exonuclease domain-containing protein [Bacteroidales bacterium]MDY4811477.1 exonuclease domain-containing protein [Muribaculaceae bacterium]